VRDLIDDGRVHVFDGAMGTELYARGVFVNVCYDEITLSRPDLVRQIHRDYAKSGAEIVETNTFGANPVKLSSYGLDGAHRGAERGGRARGPPGRGRRAQGGGRDRPARHPHRALRPDGP
jgi:methionine synthase I (cobalamin-dependent)